MTKHQALLDAAKAVLSDANEERWGTYYDAYYAYVDEYILIDATTPAQEEEYAAARKQYEESDNL